MATQPGAPPPDVDRPDVSPDETPADFPGEPSQPLSPESPDEVPGDMPATDVPDQGPIEMPAPIGD